MGVGGERRGDTVVNVPNTSYSAEEVDCLRSVIKIRLLKSIREEKINE